MYKTVIIDGRTVPLKITGGTLCIYKEQFGTDYAADVTECRKTSDIEKRLELYEIMGARLIWSLAKTADNSIGEPVEWIRSFKKFPAAKLLPEIETFVLSSFGGSDEKNVSESEPVTAERLAACCLAAGFTAADMYEMTPGFLLKTISEFCNIKSGKKAKDRTRAATQKDIDAF